MDSCINLIVNLARLKMGFPESNNLPAYEEILNHSANLTIGLDLNSNETKKCNNSIPNENEEKPLDLRIINDELDNKAPELAQTNQNQVKIYECKYEDDSSDTLSNATEEPDNTADEADTFERDCVLGESNDSLDSKQQVPAESEYSKKQSEESNEEAKLSQASLSAETSVGDSTKVEEKQQENASIADLVSIANLVANSNQLADCERYSPTYTRMRCYRCNELAFHKAWNCPMRKEDRRQIWGNYTAKPVQNFCRRSRYDPYRRLNENSQRNDWFNNGRIFGRKDNTAPIRGTFRRVFETARNFNQGEAKYSSPIAKKYSVKKESNEDNSHHKILFKGEWFTNRTAADAELYLNKKEEVARQIKKENRELDEGFEDIQIVRSDDENPNENPTLVWNNIRKHFKDEDSDPGGSSALFPARA